VGRAERAAKTVFLPQFGVGVDENDGASSGAPKRLKDMQARGRGGQHARRHEHDVETGLARSP
jgi:hypothetical protein